MATTKAPITRIPERTLRDVRTGYLYSTGDIVLIHELRHPKLGNQEYATFHRFQGQTSFAGRIVLHSAGLVRLMLASVRVDAHAPRHDGGSPATREKGISVGSVAFQNGPRTYQDIVYVYELPGLLSGSVTVQPENTWTPLDPYATQWGSTPIAREHQPRG